MIYECRPERQNHNAHLLTLLFFLLAAASFAASYFMPRYPAIPQAVGLVLLVPAIQLVARYMAVRYLYRLRALDDGTVDLEIYTYRGGTQMQLVCRVGLWEITAAAPLGKENKKPPKGLHRYRYAPDLAPAKALVLSITNGDGDCEVLLSPDEKMTEIIVSGIGSPAVPKADQSEVTTPTDNEPNK